jgi:hypothetical protein
VPFSINWCCIIDQLWWLSSYCAWVQATLMSRLMIPKLVIYATSQKYPKKRTWYEWIRSRQGRHNRFASSVFLRWCNLHFDIRKNGQWDVGYLLTERNHHWFILTLEVSVLTAWYSTCASVCRFLVPRMQWCVPTKLESSIRQQSNWSNSQSEGTILMPWNCLLCWINDPAQPYDSTM